MEISLLEFTKLVTQLESGVIGTYHHFKIPKRGETSNPITSHVMGDKESHLAIPNDEESNRDVNL